MHEHGQSRDLDNLSDVFMYENVDERQHVLRKRYIAIMCANPTTIAAQEV